METKLSLLSHISRKCGSTLTIGFVMLVFQSCQSFYVPTALNVPFLDEKGETKVSISTTDLQTAYAMSKNWGVMLNGQYVKESGKDYHDIQLEKDTNQIPASLELFPGMYQQKNGAIELAIGYFGKDHHHFIYECYTGMGLTKTNFKSPVNYDKVLWKFQSSGTKYFIQPSIGFLTPFFDVAFTNRLVGLKFRSPHSLYYDTSIGNHPSYTVTDRIYFFFEPGLLFRTGYKFIKIQTQVGMSYQMNGPALPHKEQWLNLALVFDIAKWYKSWP